jgi:hypothetical protein
MPITSVFRGLGLSRLQRQRLRRRYRRLSSRQKDNLRRLRRHRVFRYQIGSWQQCEKVCAALRPPRSRKNRAAGAQEHLEAPFADPTSDWDYSEAPVADPEAGWDYGEAPVADPDSDWDYGEAPVGKADGDWSSDAPEIGRTGAQSPRGRPFQKGVSGNPAGRPKGSRNRTTLMAELILEEGAEGLMQTAMNLAQEGNVRLISILLPKILRAGGECPVQIPLEFPITPEKLIDATWIVFKQACDDEITKEGAEGALHLLKSAIDTHCYIRDHESSEVDNIKENPESF